MKKQHISVVSRTKVKKLGPCLVLELLSNLENVKLVLHLTLWANVYFKISKDTGLFKKKKKA